MIVSSALDAHQSEIIVKRSKNFLKTERISFSASKQKKVPVINGSSFSTKKYVYTKRTEKKLIKDRFVILSKGKNLSDRMLVTECLSHFLLPIHNFLYTISYFYLKKHPFVDITK